MTANGFVEYCESSVCASDIYEYIGVGVPYGWWIFKKWTNKSCVGRLFNMLGAWLKIASYECNGTVGCGSDLMDVFVPCKVFSDMNS